MDDTVFGTSPFPTQNKGWETLCPDTLIITKAYPAFLIPTFKGSVEPPRNEFVNRVLSLLDRDQGDAMLCIAQLSSNLVPQRI